MNMLLKILTRLILPVLVIGAGVALASYYVKTSPHAQRQPPPRQARLVEVALVGFSTHRTVVQAMGTVMPSREVAVQPRVSGQILKVGNEFVPGGLFRENDVLVELDAADYELAVRQRESDWARAKSALELEMGQQSVALREFAMLGEKVSDTERALMLRQPQLARAQADVQVAQAALDLARLNLERTKVRVPFNGVIRQRPVNVGMQVTPSTTLAVLTGTDTFWVEASVPVDQLVWIRLPTAGEQGGSNARVFNESAWGSKAFRSGRVIRLLSDLERDGRMARLLVEIPDPEALLSENRGQPRMLLGDYVRVEIEGIEVESVVKLPRQVVRDGRAVWVMNERNELEIRPVQIVFRGPDHVLVRDSLRDGERIVVTDLASPVAGMPLRIGTTPSGSGDRK